VWTMKPPDGTDRLTPREAWLDGYRAGCEATARAAQADVDAARAAESPAGAQARDERIARLEVAVRALQGDAADNAGRIAALDRRVKAVEEAKP